MFGFCKAKLLYGNQYKIAGFKQMIAEFKHCKKRGGAIAASDERKKHRKWAVFYQGTSILKLSDCR